MGKLFCQIFIFWHNLYKNIRQKKQKLYQLQIAWNDRKKSMILLCWHRAFKANVHYKMNKKTQTLMQWKELFHYHIAARYERQKNVNLRIAVFNKLNDYMLRMKQKESELNKLFECFMDWKKEKIIKEWKCIYTKHQKANKLYAMMLKRKMFKAYIDCIYFSKIETQKDEEFADEHYVNAFMKKYRKKMNIWKQSIANFGCTKEEK